MVGLVSKADTVTLDKTGLHLLLELSHSVWGETELTGNEHLLTTGELEAGSSHGLLGVLKVLWLGSNGEEDLIDGNTSSLQVWLTVSTSHTLLESISTSA